MKSVSEALDLILSEAPLLPPEPVELSGALHRVLREEAVADLDLPPFDCSAMDGYAFRSGDLNSRLKIAFEIQAGSRNQFEIAPGQCARIFTGARLPKGVDRVLMQEEAQIQDGALIRPQPGGGDLHIRRKGENCRWGDVVVKSGQRLGPVDLAALASCGIVRPLLSRRPRVVHFVTGNELVDPARVPSGGEIRDCNSILIASLLARHGALLAHQSRLPDDLEASAAALAALSARPPFDLLLISGGASVGAYDYAWPLLEQSGFRLLFHGVNLRPGKPLLFAKRGSQLAFGLPGNPLSHAVVFHLFLAPLLAAMEGAAVRSGRFFQGRLDNPFAFRANSRETYLPCQAEWREGAFRLHPLPFQSSGDITGAAGVNALLRVPSGCLEFRESEAVDFLWLQAAP